MKLAAGTFLGMAVRKRSASSFIFTEYRYGQRTKLRAHYHELPYFSFALTGSYEERCFSGQSQTCDVQMSLYHPADEQHSDSFGMQGGRILSVEIPHEYLNKAREYQLRVAERTVFYGVQAKAWRRRAYAAFMDPRPSSDFSLHAVAMDLLCELPWQSALRPEPRIPGWLVQAIEILHAEFRQPIHVAGVAERVGTHPVHLARTFKRHAGKRITDYVRGLRISYALEAMARTEKSLATIASESGFSDQSHFGRVIKAQTGLTPLQFRLRK